MDKLSFKEITLINDVINKLLRNKYIPLKKNNYLITKGILYPFFEEWLLSGHKEFSNKTGYTICIKYLKWGV